jgi:hypothetical protein
MGLPLHHIRGLLRGRRRLQRVQTPNQPLTKNLRRPAHVWSPRMRAAARRRHEPPVARLPVVQRRSINSNSRPGSLRGDLVMSSITSNRSRAAGQTPRATCSGKPSRRRRRKIGPNEWAAGSFRRAHGIWRILLEACCRHLCREGPTLKTHRYTSHEEWSSAKVGSNDFWWWVPGNCVVDGRDTNCCRSLSNQIALITLSQRVAPKNANGGTDDQGKVLDSGLKAISSVRMAHQRDR